jgi:hypothetical protein
MQIKDLPAHYTLVQNSDEVADILDMLGCDEGYTYLFVEVGDGEYTTVYGSFTANMEDRAYKVEVY